MTTLNIMYVINLLNCKFFLNNLLQNASIDLHILVSADVILQLLGKRWSNCGSQWITKFNKYHKPCTPTDSFMSDLSLHRYTATDSVRKNSTHCIIKYLLLYDMSLSITIITCYHNTILFQSQNRFYFEYVCSYNEEENCCMILASLFFYTFLNTHKLQLF